MKAGILIDINSQIIDCECNSSIEDMSRVDEESIIEQLFNGLVL